MGNTNHIIQVLLKFGQEEHINDLYENGTIYMNSIQHFRRFEDNGLRGDSYEGLSKLHNLPPGQFKIEALNHTGNYLSFQIRESHEVVTGNIYSLYAISSHGFPNPLNFKIDRRINGFGSHCLFIKKNPEFLRRIEKAVLEQGLTYKDGLVHYYDKEKLNGPLSLFQKPTEYEFQKEFRVYVSRNSSEPLKLTIGSLKEIAEVWETELLINELKLTIAQK